CAGRGRGAPMDPTGVDATNWRVVLRGALVGLSVIVPVTIVRAVLDRQVSDVNQSGWVYPLFVLILVAYVVAGWVAGSGAPGAPLTHGALAGWGSGCWAGCWGRGLAAGPARRRRRRRLRTDRVPWAAELSGARTRRRRRR